jgi:hypothetical protein
MPARNPALGPPTSYKCTCAVVPLRVVRTVLCEAVERLCGCAALSSPLDSTYASALRAA